MIALDSIRSAFMLAEMIRARYSAVGTSKLRPDTRLLSTAQAAAAINGEHLSRDKTRLLGQ
jgi:hypothetical protein